MRYITVDELRIIERAASKIAVDRFAEFKDMYEKKIGDTLDEIIIDGVKTLKYSNILLIGVRNVAS